MLNSITTFDVISVLGLIFVIFQIVWMIQIRRIAKANTEYTLMQIRLLNEYFKVKGCVLDLRKINDDTANQINEGIDFNGLSDKGFKI